MSRAVVPAEPGFYVIETKWDGTTRREPVVAWVLGEDYKAYPVTPRVLDPESQSLEAPRRKEEE